MIWTEFLALARRHTDAPAVLCEAGRLSYAELAHRARTMAGKLPPRSGAGHHRVVLTETEPLALLTQILGCWGAGLVPVIAREGRSAGDVSNICRFVGAPAFAECEAPGPGRGTRPAPGAIGLRDEALVVCTSGTTGSPKLVALPAESVLINARTIGSRLSMRPGDLVAVATPLTYSYGLVGGVLSALWAGATVRLFETSAPQSVVQAAIRTERATVFQGPPTLLRLFLEYWNGKAFPDIRLVTTGGEHVDAELMERVGKAFPKAVRKVIYGMTEAGPRISHRDYDGSTGDDDVIGLPFEHFDWHIEPVEQLDLPSGAGRLVLRGPAMFLGYISETGAFEALRHDGFFRSNDLVRLAADGRLRFLDRLDRMFKSGGKLVNPGEVEDVLRRHPAVREAHCRKEPHRWLGFVPVAEIVLNEGGTITVPEIIAHCGARLQPHATPRSFAFQRGISVASSGKRQL